MQYKTFANSFRIDIPKSSGNAPFITYFNFTTPPGSQAPSFKADGVVATDRAAHLDYIGHTPNSGLSKGTAYVFGDGGSIVLDNMDLKNVIFNGVHIVYGGGKVVLNNVYFINCTFDMPDSRNTQDLAVALLDVPPATSFAGQ